MTFSLHNVLQLTVVLGLFVTPIFSHAALPFQEAGAGEAASIRAAAERGDSFDLSTIQHDEFNSTATSISTSQTNTTQPVTTQNTTPTFQNNLPTQDAQQVLKAYALPALTPNPSDQELVTWMYNSGMTRYATLEEFGFDRPITRGEISKFFTQYGWILKLPHDGSKNCVFKDIVTYDATLTPFIKQTCHYGLMQGFEGRFMPEDTLTQAQGITVVIRALEGLQDESVTPRWTNYHKLGLQKAILEEGTSLNSLSIPVTRGTVGRWLHSAVLYHQNK